MDCGERIDWNPSDTSRLWRYNLHYFDYLHPGNPLDPATGVGLIKDWVETTGPECRMPGTHIRHL